MSKEGCKDERAAMTEFWKEHSKDASEEEMMLDSHANVLTQYEVPEILSLLPDVRGKRVLELGAGIGRFTGHIAKDADHVTAVDFMESFINKNKELNKKHQNIDYLTADVTQLEIPEKSVDVVFINWLFMYLTDDELVSVLEKILRWLKDGGYLFFRESCYHQSGDTKRTLNPTKYREPLTYTAAIATTGLTAHNGYHTSYGFEIISSQWIETYKKVKSNANQICWLIQKICQSQSDQQSYKTFQEFLDQRQYSRNGILRYERIFGNNFISTGGMETTEEFVKQLDLKEGQKVLDVGSGIGGGAFYMAEHYKADVFGIDLSYNMVSLSWERAKRMNTERVKFIVADATKYDFPESSFDVVYSRDTILHIPDKASLFKRFLSWLKPGGKLLISDYCCSDGEHSSQFKEYVAQRGYNLLSPAQYGKVLENVGFINVKAEDKTDMFVQMLKKELDKTKKIKDEFIKEFCETDFDAIVDGWKDKLVRCDRGDQRWGLFWAQKSTDSS